MRYVKCLATAEKTCKEITDGEDDLNNIPNGVLHMFLGKEKKKQCIWRDLVIVCFEVEMQHDVIEMEIDKDRIITRTHTLHSLRPDRSL